MRPIGHYLREQRARREAYRAERKARRILAQPISQMGVSPLEIAKRNRRATRKLKRELRRGSLPCSLQADPDRGLTLGLAVLAKGGTLVLASCSSRITMDDFVALNTKAARKVGYRLELLERHGHALDHPVTFPEGAYLKCLITAVG